MSDSIAYGARFGKGTLADVAEVVRLLGGTREWLGWMSESASYPWEKTHVFFYAGADVAEVVRLLWGR
jgi:hypothetical protein